MIYQFKKSYFVYLSGRPMIPHLLRYQGLEVNDYDFALDALNMGHYSRRRASLDFRSIWVIIFFFDFEEFCS